MNYKLHYEKLISKAQNRSILKSEYKEVHHIIPTCIGGTDTKENKVSLFAEEHLIAHLLLHKINPKNIALLNAANMMTNGCKDSSQKRLYNNKKYAWLRKEFGIRHSRFLKENHFTLKMTKEEKDAHYKKISDINKVKYREQMERQGGHWSELIDISEKEEIYKLAGRNQSVTKSTKEFKENLSKTLKIAFIDRNQNAAKNPNAKVINIFDSNDNLIYEARGNFIEICETYELPEQRFRESQRNGGTPIYMNLNKAGLSRLKNNGNIQFKGWYAKLGE